MKNIRLHHPSSSGSVDILNVSRLKAFDVFLNYGKKIATFSYFVAEHCSVPSQKEPCIPPSWVAEYTNRVHPFLNITHLKMNTEDKESLRLILQYLYTKSRDFYCEGRMHISISENYKGFSEEYGFQRGNTDLDFYFDPTKNSLSKLFNPLYDMSGIKPIPVKPREQLRKIKKSPALKQAMSPRKNNQQGL